MATASIPPYVGYGRIGGRIYLNLSVLMTLSAAVGVSEKRYRSLTEEVFGRLPDDLEIPPVRVHRLDVIRAVLPMGLHVLGEARRDVKVLDAYLAEHPARCDRRRAEIAAVASPVELADLWVDLLNPGVSSSEPGCSQPQLGRAGRPSSRPESGCSVSSAMRRRMR
jgi:pyruvate,water dikinase